MVRVDHRAHADITLMQYSLIVRCLNEARHLPLLLEAMRRQTVPPSEVIVVDSGSMDETVSIAQRYGARILHIAREQFSFGRSLNQGIAAAGHELLVIASAHIYPLTERWIERLLEPFARPDVALVYGGQRGDERTKFSEQQLFRQWFPEESTARQEHPFCNNANVAIRRARWLEVPYDEEMPGLEDIHWAKQMLVRGHHIAYQHDALVAHVHEETYGQIYRRYLREAMALRVVSPWERLGLRDAASLMLGAILADVAEARRLAMVRRVWWSIVCFRAAQYWGAYRGHHVPGRMRSELRARLYYPPGYKPPVRAAARPAAASPVQASVPMAMGSSDGN